MSSRSWTGCVCEQPGNFQVERNFLYNNNFLGKGVIITLICCGDNINVVSLSERELVLEIDRLKHRCNSGTANNKKRNKSPTRSMECYLRSVEEERDYFKSEVDQLNKVLRAKAKVSQRSPSPCRGTPRQGSPTRSSRQQRSPGKQKMNTSGTVGSTASPAVAERKVRRLSCCHSSVNWLSWKQLLRCDAFYDNGK